MIQKIKRKKLYEQIVDQIKDMISQGIYAKGSLLHSEKELMELTGASRITVREALSILTDEGIIGTEQGKRRYVIIDAKMLKKDEILEKERLKYIENFLSSSHARLLIEPEIAKFAAKMASEDDIHRIEKTLSKKTANVNMGEMVEDFHYAIVKSVKMPLIEDFVKSLIHLEKEVVVPLSSLAPENKKRISQKINSQHSKIFIAIKERNEEFAYFYMKEHMQYILHIYEKYFSNL